RDADEIDLVTVRSGDFVVIRDEVNEDLRVTHARERLALQVAARFRLIGATVSSRGPLELLVAADDAMPVREFARRPPDATTVRRVVVVASQPEGAGGERRAGPGRRRRRRGGGRA